MENTPTKSRNPSYKENISKQQRAAIKSLSEDNSVVIKEADKGGSVVIMDKDHYKGMSFDILQNNEYYEPLEQDPQQLNKIAYKKLLKNINVASQKKKTTTCIISKLGKAIFMAYLKCTRVYR